MNRERMRTKLFDVPDDATYAGYPIVEMGWNIDLGRFYVIYEGDDLLDGWDQLIFGGEWDSKANAPRVTNFPPGLLPPERLTADEDTPGGQEARELYDLLVDAGVEVARYD